MHTSAGANGPTVRAAAEELRSAVRELALATLAREPDTGELTEAAALVRSAASAIRGPRAPDWWDGPAGADPEDLRSYRARSLFQGALHLFAPSLTWEPDVTGPDGEPALAFTVRLSNLHQGPPGAVHGGYVAGMFDELLGAAQGLTPGGGGFTGRLQVRYRRPTPLGRELRFHGWVASDRGRRIHAIGECRDGEVLCAEAEGLFVRPDAPTSMEPGQ